MNVLTCATIAILLALGSAAYAQVSGCEICHAKPDYKRVLKSGRTQSLYVPQTTVDESVHAGKQCIDCHVDVTEVPHTSLPEAVSCTQCHYEGNTVGAPQTTAYVDYERSVHGLAAASGNARAPACQDCHGSHDILKSLDPMAQVARVNVPTTCGRCHLEVFAQYHTSVHGAGLENGESETPTCAGCHEEHGVRSPKDPGSPTHVENVAHTCSVCHAAESIVGKYGISTAQVETYSESFHGVAMRFGMRTVANCASCHGVHDIRSAEDPASSVHIANIPTTCGKCHPGANVNFSRGKIHVQPQDPDSGAVYWVASFFKWLTVTTVCALVAHILLDLFRQIRQRGEAP